MTPAVNVWYRNVFANAASYELAQLTPVSDQKLFIARECAYNIYDKIYPKAIISRETFTLGTKTADDISYP